MAHSAGIQKLSNRHEAILQHLIANPTQKLGEVAAAFSVTPCWLSTIIHSHAFQEQLALRQDQMYDTAVVQPLGEKLHAAAHMALDEYMERMPKMSPGELANSTDKLLGRLGYGTGGARAGGTTLVQNNTVINNHVPRDVLEEARNRIGSKVGEANSPAALPSEAPKQGAEIEGVVVREGREQSVSGEIRSDEVSS